MIDWVIAAVLAILPVPVEQCQEAVPWMVRLRNAELGPTGGWRNQAEGDALWWVLVKRWRVRNMYVESSFADTLHAYSGRRLERPRTARERRLASVDPNNLPRVRERAEAFCRGEVRDPCPRCKHWGIKIPGSIDMRRAERAGWVRLGFGWRLAWWR